MHGVVEGGCGIILLVLLAHATRRRLKMSQITVFCTGRRFQQHFIYTSAPWVGNTAVHTCFNFNKCFILLTDNLCPLDDLDISGNICMAQLILPGGSRAICTI